MNVLVVISSLLLVLAKSQETNQTLVDYYVSLITNRSEAIAGYVFPKDARIHEASDTHPREYGEFDFIIIGAGSAGTVIANRLSEITSWKILLLEAGTYRDADLLGIPSLWTQDLFTKFNWGYETTPQNSSCLGMVDAKCISPKGKGLGGSTLINGLMFSKGNRRDYDSWAQQLQGPEYNFENLLPYFKKVENFNRTNPFAPIDEQYHGYKGPVPVTQTNPIQNISTNLIRGSEELGYTFNDYNGKEQIGISIIQLNIKNSRRFDHEMAYIAPIGFRNNLKILDRSYVIKIDICADSKKVKGVIFTRSNRTYIARNRKEVILSAGVIASPQILMLSGIGPQNDLRALGIPIIENLPVGEKVLDHACTNIIFSSNISVYQPMEQNVREYLNGSGPLTRSQAFEILGWFKTSLETRENLPDIEVAFNNISESVAAKRYYGWSDETYNVMNAKVPNPIAVVFNLLNTRSTGTIKLKNANPFEYPLINSNILGDKDNHDIENLYQGVQLLLNLTKTEAFRKLNMELAFTSFPGCENTESLSREYWYCYFRRITSIGLHQVGSCPIGKDPTIGVVDKNLKVFGIEGLRVSDASVISYMLRAHTNAPVTVIGEKTSDLIKACYH